LYNQIFKASEVTASLNQNLRPLPQTAEELIEDSIDNAEIIPYACTVKEAPFLVPQSQTSNYEKSYKRKQEKYDDKEKSDISIWNYTILHKTIRNFEKYWKRVGSSFYDKGDKATTVVTLSPIFVKTAIINYIFDIMTMHSIN
jgi:hypothetical protein